MLNWGWASAISRLLLNIALLQREQSEKTELLPRPRQAAQEAGVSYGNFCEILKRGTCNGTTLGKLARFCGVKAWELVDV